MKGFAYVAGLMDWDVLDDCLKRSGIGPKRLKIYLKGKAV